jgi:hypothetical protein
MAKRPPRLDQVVDAADFTINCGCGEKNTIKGAVLRKNNARFFCKACGEPNFIPGDDALRLLSERTAGIEEAHRRLRST